MRLLIKRIFDILFSLTLLIILMPLMAAVALLILINMGFPVLYFQKRLGHHGEPFSIIKFRTMNEKRNSDGELLPDQERLTGVGRFLRNTTLDELPELINVLKGEMSIVGPRPLIPAYRDLYSKEQWRRHEMPPGMAGPVLASGRNALSWEEKFILDVEYIENWSLGLDVRILVRTMIQVFKREGTSAEGHATMPRFTGSKNSVADSPD